MFKSVSLHYYIRLILTKHLSSCKYKFGSRKNGIVKYTFFADFFKAGFIHDDQSINTARRVFSSKLPILGGGGGEGGVSLEL